MKNKLITEGNYDVKIHGKLKPWCDAFGIKVKPPRGYYLLRNDKVRNDKIQMGDIHFDIYSGWTSGGEENSVSQGHFVQSGGRWRAWARSNKLKPKYNGKIPKKVFCFSNGTMACFDDYGKQIPMLQKKGLFELWFEWLETKGINPLEIETIKAIVNGRNVLVKPRKRKNRWSCEFILNED